MDDKTDILAFARESATSGLDLYELLGVDTSTSRDDIHRAWRRQGLKYHPDKAGANYDATLYERFAHARDVLIDDAARKVYDTAREAAAQRRLQTEQMSAERRRFKDELEAAEKAQAGTVSGEAPFAPSLSSAPLSSEREKLREAGRRRAEERQRREQEAQDRLRKREDDRIAEIEQRLREKEDKARRRAEKKAGRREGGERTERTEGAQLPGEKEVPASSESAEWRKLVSSTSAAKKEGPIEQRPLFAYTMDRLKAAGDAQRKRLAGDANGAQPPPFQPQWDEVDDPEVRKFITRVPRFAKASEPSAAVAMDMTV